MKQDDQTYIYAIAMAGEAKSLFIEAIEQSEGGKIEKAYQIYREGCDLLERAGCYQNIETGQLNTLLYAHMQNHIQMSEVIQIMTSKFIKLYEKMEEK